MTNTERAIVFWHIKQFPDATNGEILDKLWEECGEAHEEQDIEMKLDEIADAYIVATALVGRTGRKCMEDRIKDKLEIDKQRGIDGRWDKQ